jgi:hypothetical protein
MKYLKFKLYYQLLHLTYCVIGQGTVYELLEDDTAVSEHVGGV